MSAINLTLLQARLVQEPELRYTLNNTPVVNLVLAHNENLKNGERRPHFIEATAFGKIAELINKYMHKGEEHIFQGRLQQDKWVGQDGQQRSRVKLAVEQFTFLQRSNRSEESDTLKEVEETQPARLY